MFARPIPALLATAAALVAGGAAVAARPSFTIAPGPLGTALSALSRQGEIDIGGSDPALARTPTRGVRDVVGVRPALTALLEGTPFTAERVGPRAFRILRRPPTASRSTPTPAPVALPVVATRATPVDSADIIVTGAKRPVSLANYPGSATVILLGQDAFGPHGSGSQAYLLRQTPILQSTELGSGRNKYFIRGIADSSFTGPTQSTAGTYFGDVRLGYNGPDPNLNLFDVERVEVLEGPQGALYGAGSIGGVIRLAPRPAALDRAGVAFDVGGSVTTRGGAGHDLAGMVNLPLVTDHVGVRVIGYRSRDGGYIDDPGRRLLDVNRETVSGARGALRLVPATGWTVDASYLQQRSRQPDLQYAERSEGPLHRRSAIAQPFDDDYRLGRLVVAKAWDDGLRLISSTGRVRHETDQRYDATPPDRPTLPLAYDEHTSIRLTTSEVRLSRYRSNGGGGLVGAALVEDKTARFIQYGRLDVPRDAVGVVNRTRERAAFASVSVPLTRAVLVTAGARLTRARIDGTPSTSTSREDGDVIRGRKEHRFDPQLALSYRLDPRLVVFAQYQQGFRTGGLAVARDIGLIANYQSDRLYVGEVGARLSRRGSLGLAAVAAVSYARWADIQADLVSQLGFPYTANVGDGRILSFEGSLDWMPFTGLRATAAVFVNRSMLVNPAPDFVTSGRRPLPDTPPATVTASIGWTRPVGAAMLTLGANARYVGRSRIGVGPVLDLPYGHYLQTGASAALGIGRAELSLAIDNPLDTRGNRFAIGNPFGVAFRDEVTPLRPRTVRLGLKTNI